MLLEPVLGGAYAQPGIRANVMGPGIVTIDRAKPWTYDMDSYVWNSLFKYSCMEYSPAPFTP